MSRWQSFKYKNLTFFVLSLIFAFLIFRNPSVHSFLVGIGNLGYIGAFFAGILFVSTFTVAIGAVVLLILAETLTPVEIGLIAGLGAVVGDVTIFRFIKDNLIQEITPIYNRLGGKHFETILHSKYFSWTFPVVGAIVIASPLPDEIGVSLMGISKMRTSRFLLLSFILNALGIFLIVSAAVTLRN